MKDSGIEWIGEIPEGWEVSKLKYLGRYVNGYPFKPDDWGDKGKPIIRIQDLTGSTDSPNYYDGDIDAKYHIKNGDILVSWAATLDAFIWNKGDGLLNQHIFKAIPQEEKITSYFFFWMIKEAMQNMNNDNKHGIFMQHVTLDVFNNFSVPLPPLSEQKWIATYLFQKISEADIMLDDTLSSITGYKKLKQAVITQAVTKGVRGEREMKDSGVECIGKIPTAYSICKLKYLLKNPLKYGANESGIPYSDSLPRYIRITDITPDGNLKYTGKLSLSEESAKDYILEDGDILFARSGATVGKTFIYYQSYGRSAYAGYLIKASLNNKVSPKFVYYYTCSSLYEIWKNSIFIQSTIQNIGADRYANLPVPVPKTLQEQEEIADYLDAKCAEIDGLIAKKEQLVKELESYKKSLIYEVVTGKREG